MRFRALSPLFAGAALSLGGCWHPAPAPAPTVVERYDAVRGLASFDTAWARINATYYDTTFKGHDWRATRAQLRPLAERANSLDDVRSAIDSLFRRLGDSHLTLIPRAVARAVADTQPDRVARPGHLGIEVRLVGDEAIVARVYAGSAAERAGVAPGWRIEQIRSADASTMIDAVNKLENPIERRMARAQISLRLTSAARGNEGDSISIRMTADGQKKVKRVALSPWEGEIVQFGPLPPQYLLFESQQFNEMEGCVGLVRFSVWMLPVVPKIEQAMSRFAECRGVVLDLRGNPGGIAALVMRVGGYFVNEEVALGTMTQRNGTMRYLVNPHRSTSSGERATPYDGRLAILIDEQSASTSEIFAQGMRDLGRARLFGEETAGQALPAAMSKLPTGDIMMHPVGDYRSASGARIEALGVAPDERIPLRIRDLRSGLDAPLAAAIRWINANVATNGQTGTSAVKHP